MSRQPRTAEQERAISLAHITSLRIARLERASSEAVMEFAHARHELLILTEYAAHDTVNAAVRQYTEWRERMDGTIGDLITAREEAHREWAYSEAYAALERAQKLEAIAQRNARDDDEAEKALDMHRDDAESEQELLGVDFTRDENGVEHRIVDDAEPYRGDPAAEGAAAVKADDDARDARQRDSLIALAFHQSRESDGQSDEEIGGLAPAHMAELHAEALEIDARIVERDYMGDACEICERPLADLKARGIQSRSGICTDCWAEHDADMAETTEHYASASSGTTSTPTPNAEHPS